MLAERYKLVVEGIVDGADSDAVKLAVSERFNMPIAQVHRLFAQDQVTLRDDLDKERAWHVHRLLEDLNVRSKVVPMPLSNLKLAELTLEQRPMRVQAGNLTLSQGASAWQAPRVAMPVAPVQSIKSTPYRSRRTAVKTGAAATQDSGSSLKLSSILLLAGAIVACAYLAKLLLPGLIS